MERTTACLSMGAAMAAAAGWAAVVCAPVRPVPVEMEAVGDRGSQAEGLSGAAATPPRRMIVLPPEVAQDMGRMVAACFSAENPPPPEVIARLEQFYAAQQQVGYQLGNRWSGTMGDPRVLTWSFVPDGLNISGGAGEPAAPSDLFSKLDSQFATHGGRAMWVQQFVNVFARWSALSGMTYTRISVGGNDWDDGASWGSAGAAALRGDIRISMHTIDGANGILAYTYFPSNGDMVFDDAENWAQTSNTYRFLRNTAQHEHGHGLGFNHVCPVNKTKLMEPFLATTFDGPQQDDIRAVQRYYGDPAEGDNTAAAAEYRGTFSPGGSLTVGTIPTVSGTVTFPTVANASLYSIDNTNEQDWSRFTATGPMLLNVTLTPVGSTYDNSTQDASTGNCNSGNNINSLAVADLLFRVYDASGVTQIIQVNGTTAGNSESLSGLLIPPGDFYIVVSASGAVPTTQLYKYALTSTATTLTASDGAFTDRVSLSWTPAPGATQYQVLRGTTSDQASATQIGTSTTNVFDDLTATVNQTYYYWVTATQYAGANRLLAGPESGYAALAAPGSFSLLTPVSSATGVSLTPTLDWSDSPNATSYTLTIDDNADFSSPVLSVNVATSAYTVGSGLLGHNTVYYWKVVAKNAASSTGSSPASATFTTELVPCPADFNHDGFVDVFDFTDFVSCFEGTGCPAGLPADFNLDGFVDVYDFNDFVTAFEAGC